MKKAKDLFKDNYRIISALALPVIMFYAQLVSSGISTDDEWMNIFFVRTDRFFSSIPLTRGAFILFNLLPSYVHALCNGLWTYKLLTLLALLFSCFCFASFIGKLAGKEVSWAGFALFFLFAQFEGHFDGLYSFSFSYQLNSCYVFAALSLYIDYLRNGDKKKKIISALLYLFSSMAYEAFVLYGALFFIIDLYYLAEKKEIKILTFIKDLWLHAGLVIIYVIFYFLVGGGNSETAGDATFGTGITVKEFCYAMYKLAVGLFPLNYREYSWGELVEQSLQPTAVNAIRLVMIVATLYAIYRLIKKSKKITLKQYLMYTILCIIGTLLPGVLIAMTNRFIEWINYGDLESFGTSYYAYFFIIAWLCVSIVFIYHLLGRKNYVVTILLIICGITAEFTCINNEIMIDRMHPQYEKVRAFDGFVRSDYFKNIENNATIYAPEYFGINGNQWYLDEYVRYVTGKNVHFINDEELRSSDGPNYDMFYCFDEGILTLSEVNDADRTDEIYIFALHGANGLGFITERDSECEDAIYVDGKPMGVFAEEIIVNDLNVNKREFVISCKDIISRSIEFCKFDNDHDYSVINTEGLYDQEDWGRWAEKECDIVYDNTYGTDSIHFDLSIATPGEDGSSIKIEAGEYEETVAISGQTEISVDIPVNKGYNTIRLISDAADLTAEGDPRNLNMQIFDFDIEINGNTLKINDPSSLEDYRP